MTTWKDLFAPGEATNFFDPPPPRPFNHESVAFDGVNAWWLAELSRLSYRENNDRKDFLARVGLEELDFINASRDTQGFLVAPASKTWAALVFRGTSTPRDFLTDADVGMAPFDAGKVHHGFKDGFEAAWPGVSRDLAALPATCRVFYAGHSLGAALATLAASRKRPAATYTFGSPRVGNRAFTSSVDASRTFRVVDHHDLVAQVPLPLLFFFGYRHVGQRHDLAHLPDEPSHSTLVGQFRKDRKNWLDKLIQESPLGPPDPLADHAPINYVDRIGAKIGFPLRRR